MSNTILINAMQQNVNLACMPAQTRHIHLIIDVISQVNKLARVSFVFNNDNYNNCVLQFKIPGCVCINLCIYSVSIWIQYTTKRHWNRIECVASRSLQFGYTHHLHKCVCICMCGRLSFDANYSRQYRANKGLYHFYFHWSVFCFVDVILNID